MVVYILELKDGFYSISRFSMSQIKNGSGTSWTKLHPPISIIKTIYNNEDDDEDFNEDDIVYEYMRKYGVDKVRGGTYNSAVLSEYQINTLNQKLKKQENSYIKNKELNNSIMNDYNYNNNDFTTVIYDSLKKNNNTNLVSNVSNTVLSSQNACSYCEMSFANESLLKKHEQKCMDSYFTKVKNDGKQCERCGRETHTTQYCKAKTDIHGYSI